MTVNCRLRVQNGLQIRRIVVPEDAAPAHGCYHTLFTSVQTSRSKGNGSKDKDKIRIKIRIRMRTRIRVRKNKLTLACS